MSYTRSISIVHKSHNEGEAWTDTHLCVDHRPIPHACVFQVARHTVVTRVNEKLLGARDRHRRLRGDDLREAKRGRDDACELSVSWAQNYGIVW